MKLNLKNVGLFSSKRIVTFLLAIMVVSGTGSLAVENAYAQTPPPDPGSWHLVKTASVNWTPGKQATPNFGYTLVGGGKYRWCMRFTTTGSGSNSLLEMQTTATHVNYSVGSLIAGTYTTCTPTITPSSTINDNIAVYNYNISLTVTALSWQQYY